MKINNKEYVSIKEGASLLGMNYFQLYFHLPKLKTKKIDNKTLIEKESIDIFSYVRKFIKNNK